MDEMISVMNALWDDERPEFHGKYYDMPPSGFEPKPVQRPHPPWVMGGFSEAAFKRAIERGDGWFGGSPSREHAGKTVAGLQRRRAEIGRPPLEITLLTGWAQGFDLSLVEGYEAAGVHRVVVTPWSSSRNAREGIEEFAAAASLS
jgi:hypothetical protein